MDIHKLISTIGIDSDDDNNSDYEADEITNSGERPQAILIATLRTTIEEHRTMAPELVPGLEALLKSGGC